MAAGPRAREVLPGRQRPANTLNGDGALKSKPRNAAPDEFVLRSTESGPDARRRSLLRSEVFPWGPLDQRPVEKRRDVLVYSSAPLRHDLEVTGPMKVVLYVSSSAPDTDFTAKLVDVFPNGEARNLTDGILRLRYRDSLEKPEPVKPGEMYKVTIDAGVTSNVFLKGHRIRVEISSSNFPRFDRNLNTGRAIADEKDLRKATQTVFHDRGERSFVLLPVVPSAPAELTSSRQARVFFKAETNHGAVAKW